MARLLATVSHPTSEARQFDGADSGNLRRLVVMPTLVHEQQPTHFAKAFAKSKMI